MPSIETKNYKSIFEEQVVADSLLATGINLHNVIQGNIYSIEENTFYFKNLIPSQNPDGVEEKFRIVNTGKVKANLQLECTAKAGLPFCFSISQNNISINPHEFVYVSVKFKPEIMTAYEGVFAAKIIHPDSKDSNNLKFSLRGEGILPTIKIQGVNLVENNLNFGRIKLNDNSTQSITAFNGGNIPATIACNFPNSPNFRLISDSEMSLMPGESHVFQIEFQPKEQKKIQHQINFITEQNPFEKMIINLNGEGFYEELSFEQIQDD